MSNESQVTDTDTYGYPYPIVRDIRVKDLLEALTKAIDDFKALPTHLIFLCIIYPAVTVVFARAFAGYDVLPLVFPLLAGYTLIGPVVAIGVYELSRRRELGEMVSRLDSFKILRNPSIASIVILTILLMVIYFAWLVTAQAIYTAYMGDAIPESIMAFVGQVFGTAAGWGLIVVGSGVGFVFAVVVFSLSVVSFPLLLDRNVGVVVAIQTSIKAVMSNPLTMFLWGLVVALLLIAGSLPLFVGLAIVLPVLGHATWHVYRKVVQ